MAPIPEGTDRSLGGLATCAISSYEAAELSLTALKESQPPMGKLNRLEGSIRHGCATTRRETHHFMKRHGHTNLRHFILMVSHNIVNPISATKRQRTPATNTGLFEKPLSWNLLLQKRFIGAYRGLDTDHPTM